MINLRNNQNPTTAADFRRLRKEIIDEAVYKFKGYDSNQYG